jgi:integrase
LAEYLELERSDDDGSESETLFLSAAGIPARRQYGRLSVQAVNLLLERIVHWHDAEVTNPARQISPLKLHELRYTFAYLLATKTGMEAYELERRLRHGSQRYNNPLEHVAAGYDEEF